MKNSIIYFITFCLWGLTAFSQSKTDSLRSSAIAFQSELNAQYADSLKSPLLKEDMVQFKMHNFYPVDMKFCIEADFKKTPGENTFEMKTTGTRRPMYYKFGEIHFTIDGKKLQLNVYQSMDLLNKPEYKDYLFVPFTDLTNGKETYGGGRYIDLRIPKSDKIIVDFNKAYNPYCAYNHKYSCPIPPKENALDTEIKAGIKMDH
jgi:uncharacterized protein (DUF1684 family)